MRRTRPQPPGNPAKPNSKSQVPPVPVKYARPDLWICLGLLLLTFLLYGQLRHFDFVNFDDPDYVTRNLHVQGGLTGNAVMWAFTSREAANWFPITRLSHILDVQIFGMNSGWHHLVNLLWHALSAVMLFLFLHRATRARWPAAVVALVFAVHPLHVESVAWIAERKDVLSAFFWFFTLWAYVRYAERPGPSRYALVLASFCLGLMAKPMVVTLPFVLLLLDLWPLERFRPGERFTPSAAGLLQEKLPFFAISASAAVATYLSQNASGAVSSFPLGLRLENAVVSYGVYVFRTFWPAGLAVFYPFPAEVPWWQAVLSAAALAGISGFALRLWKSHPYLAVGWLWYLGTLVPVIGLVQVGGQARADRYLYIPMAGLIIMLAWGAADLVQRWIRLKPVMIAMTVGACVALAAVTWVQAQYWKDSVTLFRHALDVTSGNYVAHHNLGIALADSPGGLPEAIEHYQAALQLKPDSAKVHTDLANALARTPDRLPEAVGEYRIALQIDPNSAVPHNDLGNALAKFPGRLPEAVTEYQTALRLAPDYAEAHNNLGSVLAQLGRMTEATAEWETAVRLDRNYGEARTNLARALSETPAGLASAIAQYQEVLRLNPNVAEAHVNLGIALAQSGRLSDAIGEYQTALRIDPISVDAHISLGNALSESPNRMSEATAEYETALRLQPRSAEAHYNLGVALSKAASGGRAAIPHFETALGIKPEYPEAHNNLGVELSKEGRTREAIAHFEAALQIRPRYADAHYNLGVALAGMPGRLPEAIAQFEAARQINGDPELEKLIHRLRSGGK